MISDLRTPNLFPLREQGTSPLAVGSILPSISQSLLILEWAGRKLWLKFLQVGDKVKSSTGVIPDDRPVSQ